MRETAIRQIGDNVGGNHFVWDMGQVQSFGL